jgi:hypothetical protein
MMMNMNRVAASLLIASAALLGGCASAPSPQAMTPETIQATKHHPYSVSVGTATKEATSPTSDSPLATALMASIEKNKVFSKVIKGEGADYQLTVMIMTVDTPAFGLSFTVKTEMAWSLKRTNGAVVWQDTIKSEGTAGATEAFAGAERSKMAFERAARENIAQGLAKISGLNL